MAHTAASGRSFSVESEPVDVTMLHRPDPSWSFVDAAGHEHRWHVNGSPATDYDPRQSYNVPTLIRVVDAEYIDEDGYERTEWHLECFECRAHVVPGYTSDTTRQLIPGLRRYYIDGARVTDDEFMRAAKEDGLIP